MHPQISQQEYAHNDFGLFTSPHPNPPLSNSTQPLAFNGLAAYSQDAYAPFDMSKPINQFHYMPSPQQNQPQQYPQNYPSSPSVTNNFSLSSYPMHVYQTPEPKHRQPSTSISRDDSVPTPIADKFSALRVPKFDRTYTDALEDELYDGSSTSQSVYSQNHTSRQPTPNFGFPVNQFSNHVYVDQNARTPAGSLSEHEQHAQRAQRQQQQGNLINSNKSISTNMMYSPSSQTYDPLRNRRPTNRSSVSSAVADSVRRLQTLNRTTVSPREAFLDYPDNADFRERKLFAKSVSPYPQGHETPESLICQESEGSLSNDDYNGSEVMKHNSVPLSSVPFTLPDTRSTLHPTSLPLSPRSNGGSARKSGPVSAEMSMESSTSSDSEYDPAAASGRQTSRSSGRTGILNKTFPCPECGKRFKKAQPLHAHRRNSHGKGKGPSSLNIQKFSNTPHRCSWADPTTGKTCNTVFSRP
jgi:hypothetical protein